jgi:hypothetical protein
VLLLLLLLPCQLHPALPPASPSVGQVSQATLEHKLAEHVERIDTDMALEYQVSDGSMQQVTVM